MGEMKHTPGPWVVGPVDDTVVTHLGADGRRYEVAAIDGDYNDPDTWPIMEANARLIAAAPDLRAIAEAIVAADHSELGVIDLLLELKRIARTAQAALSKAEGRSLSSASGQEGGANG